MVELAVLHGKFQSAVDGAVPGHEASLRRRADKPRVILKVLSNKLELEYGQICLKFPLKNISRRKLTPSLSD